MGVTRKEYKGKDLLECCSLLVDGECSENELDEILALHAEDDGFAEGVREYHLIGDLMRSSEFAQSHITLSKRFEMATFKERLAQEPLILAPLDLKTTSNKKQRKSLSWPHWTGLAVASVAVVSLVGVLYAPQDGLQEHNIQPMQLTAAAEAEAQAPIADQRAANASISAASVLTSLGSKLQENRRRAPSYYMAAHQQFGYDTTYSRGNNQVLAMQTVAQQ